MHPEQELRGCCIPVVRALVVPIWLGCFVSPWRQNQKPNYGAAFVTICSAKPAMQSDAGGVRCVQPPVPHGLPAPWTKPLPVGAGVAEQHLVVHPGWAAGSQTPSWQPEKLLATQSINTPSPACGWLPSLAVPSSTHGLGAAPQIVEVWAQKFTFRV